MEEAWLCQTPLFRGISPGDTAALLKDLGAQARRYAKGAVILRAGDPVRSLGLVLSGSVLIARDDFWGSTTVLARVEPGQIFAETYACTPGEPLMVRVSAADPAEILFVRMDRILSGAADASQDTLVRNLLTLFAQKNLMLSRKIFHTAPKTIRGRVLSYLSEQAVRAGSRRFAIPFDRQQLADYLGVDRSALSHELGKLQKEGLLRVEKNRFELKTGCQDYEL